MFDNQFDFFLNWSVVFWNVAIRGEILLQHAAYNENNYTFSPENNGYPAGIIIIILVILPKKQR